MRKEKEKRFSVEMSIHGKTCPRVCSSACENPSLEPMGGLAKRFILFCDTAKKAQADCNRNGGVRDRLCGPLFLFPIIIENEQFLLCPRINILPFPRPISGNFGKFYSINPPGLWKTHWDVREGRGLPSSDASLWLYSSFEKKELL